MVGGGKQTRGRQKIEMKMIENEDDRLITFSKRRSGIYKKASELTTLCGADVAILIFSPSGKPYSFGHPSIEHVANRFLNNPQMIHDNTHPLLEAHRRLRINELNQQYNELVAKLEAEKARGKELMQLSKGYPKGWWETPVEDFNTEKLKELNSKLLDLHKKVWSKINEKSGGEGGGTSSSLFVPAENPGQAVGLFDANQNEVGPSLFRSSPANYGYERENF